jgi:hypothetical protein
MRRAQGLRQIAGAFFLTLRTMVARSLSEEQACFAKTATPGQPMFGPGRMWVEVRRQKFRPRLDLSPPAVLGM